MPMTHAALDDDPAGGQDDKALLLSLMRNEQFKHVNDALVRLYNGRADPPLQVRCLTTVWPLSCCPP